jgi:hypothetical protein
MTATTVGYGDYSAVTTAGRIMAVFVAYLGIIGIALPRYWAVHVDLKRHRACPACPLLALLCRVGSLVWCMSSFVWQRQRQGAGALLDPARPPPPPSRCSTHCSILTLICPIETPFIARSTIIGKHFYETYFKVVDLRKEERL